MDAETTVCPICEGSRLVSGQMIGIGDASVPPGFGFPGAVRMLGLPVGPAAISLERPATLCLDCGLVRASVDPAAAVKAIQRWGTADLKRSLGLDARKAPAADDLT